MFMTLNVNGIRVDLMNNRDLIFVGNFKIINDEKKKEVKLKQTLTVCPPLYHKKRLTQKKSVVSIGKSFS